MATAARKIATRPTRAPAKKTRPVGKSATAAARAAVKPEAKSQAATPKTAAPKPAKPKKPKLVRDSFTIPKTEYAAIDALKRRAAASGRAPKKSELLRAGLMVLAGLSDLAFAQALAAVPAIKTGRPKA